MPLSPYMVPMTRGSENGTFGTPGPDLRNPSPARAREGPGARVDPKSRVGGPKIPKGGLEARIWDNRARTSANLGRGPQNPESRGSAGVGHPKKGLLDPKQAKIGQNRPPDG